MTQTFADHQRKAVSEKATLVILEAARRLQGWTVHAGSVYKIDPFKVSALSDLTPIKQNGTALTAAASIAGVTAGKYYWDRQAKVLYLRTSGSTHPNGEYISCVERLFFSKKGHKLPHDLTSGYAVHWQPLLAGTSDFGVGVDHVNQIGEAIEGTGSVTLMNRQDFWAPRFEKLYFENQRAFVYAWSPSLPVSEAKLIYRGRITNKEYSPARVSFKLQDLLYELRSEISLETIASISGAKIPRSLESAKQRLVYGKIFGHRPTNIDQVDREEGYPLTGTVSISAGLATLTGSGTNFLQDLSPDDEVLIAGMTGKVTIGSIEGATAATLSEEVTQTISGAAFAVFPRSPKRYINREWVLCGHAIRTPETTVVQGFATNEFEVVDTEDLDIDASLLIDGTEIVKVKAQTPGNRIWTRTNLLAVPAAGATVKRLPVENVKINSKLLVFDRDYAVDEASGRLTLDPLAEFNVAPARFVSGTVTFVATSRTVTGSGTSFLAQLKPGDWIRNALQSTYYEILQVNADDELILRAASGYSSVGDAIFKSPEIFDPNVDVLTCDMIGATEDGTTSGTWIKTAAQVVKDLMIRAGLEADLDAESFDVASELGQYPVGLAVPAQYEDSKGPSYREVINRINQSVFGELLQTPDFKYRYRILSPERSLSTLAKFIPADAISWAIRSQSDKIVGLVRVRYLNREYDPASGEASSQVVEFQNEDATYLAVSSKAYEQETVVVDETAAQTLCERWAFLFSMAMSIVKVSTGLKGARLQIGDPVSFSHPKLFERMGSTEKRKVGAVVSVKKSGEDSSFEFEDLANAFSSCGVITEDDAGGWSEVSAGVRCVQGFITDTYGDIGNSPDEFGLNRIW